MASVQHRYVQHTMAYPCQTKKKNGLTKELTSASALCVCTGQMKITKMSIRMSQHGDRHDFRFHTRSPRLHPLRNSATSFDNLATRNTQDLPMPMPPTTPGKITFTEEWKKDAACKDLADSNIFFPPEPITTPRAWDKAREFCQECTVKKTCLDYALEHEAPGFRRYGMFGGMTPKERDEYSAKP